MTHRDRAKRIIASNLYMTLATTKDGSPWSTPVFYACDENYTFYWYSRKDTRHSLTIQNNNKVACSIFGVDTEGGVYVEGIASEVTEDELPHVLDVYAQKGAKTDEEREQLTTKEDFLGDAPLRMYKLIPEKIYVSGEATKWHG